MLTIVKLIIYYFGYQLGFSVVAMLVSKYIAPMDLTMTTSVAMVASTVVMMWHLLHFKYADLSRDKYREVSRQVLLVSIVFVFAAMYVLNLLIEQAGIPNTMEDTFIEMSRNPLGLLSIALLAPILEEMLFRGSIEGYLLKAWKSPWGAIIVSSLVFGVVHMNPAQIPFAFLLGVMFGWLYYRTGSLLPGIIGHVLNNSVAAVNMILYGDIPLEEQVQDEAIMWTWAAIATVAFVLATLWLNRRLGAGILAMEAETRTVSAEEPAVRPEEQVVNPEEPVMQSRENRDADGYLRSEK